MAPILFKEQKKKKKKTSPLIPAPAELEVTEMMREPVDEPVDAVEVHVVQSLVQKLRRLCQLGFSQRIKVSYFSLIDEILASG